MIVRLAFCALPQTAFVASRILSATRLSATMNRRRIAGRPVTTNIDLFREKYYQRRRFEPIRGP